MTATLVIGLGNPDRGDDALGLAVIDALVDRGAAGRLLRWTGPEIDLLDVWSAEDDVVLVDASRGAGPPGTITHLGLAELLGDGAPTFGATHALGIGAALALAELLGRLPRRVEVRAVEAAGTSLGSGLSPPVAAARDVLVDDLVRLLAARGEHDLAMPDDGGAGTSPG